MADELPAFHILGALAERSLEIESYLRQNQQTFGLDSITPAELRLLAALRGRVNSTSRLAKRLGTSRQAAHALVAGLSQKGLVVVEDSGTDKREKIVLATEAGHQHRRAIGKLLEAMENDVAEQLGERNYRRLAKLLQKPWMGLAE